jgi:hypothetical protein
MTQEDFVTEQSIILLNNDFSDPTPAENYISLGLTKGLEIAEVFVEWFIDELLKKQMGKDSMIPNEGGTAKDALTIFLTEKYGK